MFRASKEPVLRQYYSKLKESSEGSDRESVSDISLWQPPTNRRSPWSKLCAVSILLNVIFLIMTIFALSRLDLSLRLTEIPDVEKHAIRFSSNQEFEDLSHAGDAAWNKLLTPNGGFLVQKTEEQGEKHIFGITMFHQLHCLQMIRMKWQQLRSNQSEQTPIPEAHHHHADVDDSHAEHCLDYLRQVYMPPLTMLFQLHS